MTDLNNLHEYTDTVLHGLVADEALKHRILNHAAESGSNRKGSFVRPVAVLCTMLSVFLLMIIVLNGINPVSNENQNTMHFFSAGKNETEKPGFSASSVFLSGFDVHDIKQINCATLGTVRNADTCILLVRILTEQAVPGKHDFAEDPEDTLSIQMSNGSTVVLPFSEPYLFKDSECWKCERFFDEYRKAAEQ